MSATLRRPGLGTLKLDYFWYSMENATLARDLEFRVFLVIPLSQDHSPLVVCVANLESSRCRTSSRMMFLREKYKMNQSVSNK